MLFVTKTRFTLEESFSTGLVLPFTHEWTNPNLKLPVMSPEILNPVFLSGNFESEKF